MGDDRFTPVAFRYSGVYIFYENVLPLYECGMYILHEQEIDDLVYPAIFRALAQVYPVLAFEDITKFLWVGVKYKDYLSCDEYVERIAMFYSEYPCCWLITTGEVVFLDTPFGNIKYDQSLVQMVYDTYGCQDNLDSHYLIAYLNLIKTVYKRVWLYRHPYWDIYRKGSFIEYHSHILFVNECGCDIDGNCTDKHDCFVSVGVALCCDFVPVSISALYSKYEYDDYVADNVFDSEIYDFSALDLGTTLVRGCDATLDFYLSTGQRIGEYTEGVTTDQYESNVIWEYYIRDHRLLKVDTLTGGVIYDLFDIHNLGQLNVSVDILESCEFHFIVPKTSDFGGYLPAILTIEEYVCKTPDIFDIGINNTYITNRVYPYTIEDADNPTHFFGHLALLQKWYYYDKLYVMESSVLATVAYSEFTGIVCSDIDYSNLVPNTYFYLSADFIHNAIALSDVKKITKTDFDILLPKFSVMLYPALLSIQRKDETINNRPVYEPWMLYLIDFVYIKSSEDIIDDPIIIKIFDLSPNWG